MRISTAIIYFLLFFITSIPAFAKPYKGAELYSNAAVLYGKFEFRMRAVKGEGILSTFFLYKNGSEQAETFWEEIDIEVFGKDNAVSFQSNIITDGLGGQPVTMSEEVHTRPVSLADGYHTYALEWTPNYVAWFIDGVEVRKTTGGQVSDLTNPMTIRFNIWASTSPSWVGTFDDSVLPVHQYVNWLKYSSYSAGVFTEVWTDDFSSFNSTRWGMANWTFAGNYADFDPANINVQDGMLILSLTTDVATGYNGTVPADEPTGIISSQNSKEPSFIKCNPVLDYTLILDLSSHQNKDCELVIFNEQGKELWREIIQSTFETSIEIPSTLKSGIYFIRVNSKESESSGSFILQ